MVRGLCSDWEFWFYNVQIIGSVSEFETAIYTGRDVHIMDVMTGRLGSCPSDGRNVAFEWSMVDTTREGHASFLLTGHTSRSKNLTSDRTDVCNLG